MIASVLWIASLLQVQGLLPAGTINDALSNREATFLIVDDARVKGYVDRIRAKFFPKSAVLAGAEIESADLKGRDLVVYGTPELTWLARHAAALPFRFGEDRVTIDGREFAGEHLRVICAVRNPDDPARRATLYAAKLVEDLIDINNLFHGPTEWLVADGERTLAAGSFALAPPVAADDLLADLDELTATIDKVHCATAKGRPPELQRAIDEARSALSGPRTRDQAWRELSRVLMALHDAHSGMGPPQSGERLALHLAWLADGLFVAEDAGELRRGDRVLSLAGRDERALLAALAGALPAENEHWIRAQGEWLLADTGVLRALGSAETIPVPVRVERGGKELQIDLGLATAGRPAPTQPWVRFEIDAEHDLALFVLERCDVDDTYRETLDRFFRAVQAKGIQRVAVDVRRNSGGNSEVIDEFLRYVDVDEYTIFGCDVRWSKAVSEKRGELFPLSRHHEPSRRKNDKRSDPPPFAGELLVLTGPHTFSSGNWFAVIVQDNGLGKIVGEPTGNAPSSFGDVLGFTLPRTGLSYSLTFKRWIRPDPARDPADAMVPDVAVPRTREHLARGEDPVLAYLRRDD